MKIAGIILAGGQSRRMGGREKSLLELEGLTQLEWVAKRLGPQVQALAINANGDASRFQSAGLPVIADTIGGHIGPLAGVLAGMRWAQSQDAFTHIATGAADTPFIPHNFVERLTNAINNSSPIAMAASNGRIHPVAALWPIDLADDLEQFLTVENERKILVFAKRHGLNEVVFGLDSGPTGHDPFFNINTPDDLAIAGEIAADLPK